MRLRLVKNTELDVDACRSNMFVQTYRALFHTRHSYICKGPCIESCDYGLLNNRDDNDNTELDVDVMNGMHWAGNLHR